MAEALQWRDSLFECKDYGETRLLVWIPALAGMTFADLVGEQIYPDLLGLPLAAEPGSQPGLAP